MSHIGMSHIHVYLARRIELDREPDLGIVDLWGRRNQPENKPRKFEMYNKLLFTAQHPKVTFGHITLYELT